MGPGQGLGLGTGNLAMGSIPIFPVLVPVLPFPVPVPCSVNAPCDARCDPLGPISFILMQILAKIWPNNRLVPLPWALAPPVWDILDPPMWINIIFIHADISLHYRLEAVRPSFMCRYRKDLKSIVGL